MRTWTRRIKHVMGRVLFGLRLHRLLMGPQGVIVLFHRVDDELKGNPISCTSDEFRQFAGFFRRYFEVVSLEDFLDQVEEGESLAGKVAITFDDGYLDNHRTAAPILEELGLPACFFITTGFIGTERVPWWDEELGIRSRWMSWSDVSDLAQRGFELGAHTVNHPDLGKLEGEAAVAEIQDSREALERRTGQSIPCFSYPFGRRDQITEWNRDAVRKLGFRCCLSAYGGVVEPGSDPFRLRRWPISPWYLSPYQLGWEIVMRR